MTDIEIKETMKRIAAAALREELEALRDKITVLLEEPQVNVHAGYSPNMWVEQDPRDKAKNLLKRL